MSAQRSRARVGFSLLSVGLLSLAGLWTLPAPASATTPFPKVGQFAQIQHVVMVMLENRAFDHYFGVYCPAKTAECPMTANGIPPNTCVPYNTHLPRQGCVRPYNFTGAQMSTNDLPHTWYSSHQAYDFGKMDGFYAAESKQVEAFGHYNGSTVPVYWDIAQQFGLSDAFFSSVLSYSLPNHWYFVAGQSPPSVLNLTQVGISVTAKHLYLDEANETQSIEQLAENNSSVSWKYYDYALVNYSKAIQIFGGNVAGSAYAVWNPLAAKNQSYSLTQHFAPQSDFFSDVTNGTLPNITYMIPSWPYSDHPPANVTQGEDWVASISNAVARSPYWNNTAIFVTWDEYGGFYDHVAPAQVDANGLAFRVPLLVISPWTPAGYIGHHPLEFTSLLHFVEWRWNLGCLTQQDCGAALPLGFFDFTVHRNPVLFPYSDHAVYPYQPPTDDAGMFDPATHFSDAPPPSGTIDWT